MKTGYYFGPMNVTDGHNKYAYIGIAKTDYPEYDLMPIIRYAFGPYKTQKEAIQKAHYQFNYITKFYFINIKKG